MSNTQEMPKYNCTKKVHALKIKEIKCGVDDDSIVIHFADAEFSPLVLTKEDQKNKPVPEEGWYFVVYRDGYTSFSPPGEFEDGYNLAIEGAEEIEPEELPKFLGDLATGNLVPFDETLAKDPVMIMVKDEAEWEWRMGELREAIDAVISSRGLTNVVNAEFFETQDPKYLIIGGQLCNAFTKEPIPTDEPIFILRGKDIHAYPTLDFYEDKCTDEEHRNKVADRMLEFDEFKSDNDDLMGEPDTLGNEDFPEDSETSAV